MFSGSFQGNFPLLSMGMKPGKGQNEVWAESERKREGERGKAPASTTIYLIIFQTSSAFLNYNEFISPFCYR